MRRPSKFFALFFSLTTLCCCQLPDRPPELLDGLLRNCASATGSSEYIHTPYVTAGDRLYMVGLQDGSFPDLGWHIAGEMGGIWDHPIKLMDGFSISFQEDGEQICLPPADRFINYPVGNQLIINEKSHGLHIVRTQFVPDGTEGVVIDLQIQNQRNTSRQLELTFNAAIDLRPTWLADSLNIQDGNDSFSWDDENHAIVAKDSLNEWYVVIGSNRQSELTNAVDCRQAHTGHGVDAAFQNSISIKKNSTANIRYYITGSHQNKDEAIAAYKLIKEHASELLKEKVERYQRMDQQAAISIPDTALAELYKWVRYDADWLIRDVAGTGRGLSAGLPDYPWWFGADNCYALQGMLSTGRFEEVKSTIDLIHQLSEKRNGNGRVIHEVSTNGVTYNPGNLNETPQFAVLIWKAYEWMGDRELLEKYYPFVKKGLEWLEQQDHDHNGYPDGAGMMEIPGLHSEMIDVVVYTQQAYQAASLMAEQIGDADAQALFQRKAAELRAKINDSWWSPDAKSFIDFRATKAQALALIDQAIVRADTLKKPWAVAELKETKKRVERSRNQNGFVVHHNWVVNTPLEMHIADEDKAQLALATARKYTNRFGMYVTGIDRDENVSSTEKWKSFSYVGAVMTLPTGVQAIAEASYGNPDEALRYLNMLNNSFSYALPGSLYEVSPDYGMFVQAWTIYSVAVPIVNHFFGINPIAYEKTVVVQPDMPATWDNASISNVMVGDNSIGVIKTSSAGVVQYAIKQVQADWAIKLRLKLQPGVTYEVNGQEMKPTQINQLEELALTGTDNVVKVLTK